MKSPFLEVVMKLGIGKKLFACYFAGMGIFLFLVLFGYLSLSTFISLQKRSGELSTRTELIGELRSLIYEMLMPPNDYLITGDRKERENFAGLVTRTASTFEKIRSGDQKTKEELEIEKEVESGFVEIQKKAMVLLSLENPVGNKEGGVLMEEMDAFAEGVAGKVEVFHKFVGEETNAQNRRIAQITRWGYMTFATLLFISLMGFIVVAILIKRGITGPISELRTGVKLIADGNLGYRIDLITGDEVEELGREFNGMAGSLQSRIEEVKNYSEKLERTNRRLDQNILQLYTLYNISKTLTATFEMEKLLTQVVESVSQGVRMHRLNIMLVSEDRQDMRIVAGINLPDEALNTKFRMGEGIYGWVAASGQAEVINNISEYPGFKSIKWLDEGMDSLACVPFKGRGQVIGLINAYKVGEGFDEASFELLVTAGAQIGMALENARLFEETKLLSITDGLTGLYNRRYFTDRIGEEYGRARRYGRPLSIIMMDVDYFKKFNDTHGHPQGDRLLTGIADIIRKTTRKSDIVARYGGEEFVVVLPETAGEIAGMLAERLRTEVDETEFPGGKTQPGGRVTISLGVASCNGSASADELVSRADEALYKAKGGGKNKVCFYNTKDGKGECL